MSSHTRWGGDDPVGYSAILTIRVIVIGSVLLLAAYCARNRPADISFEQPQGMYTVTSGRDVFKIDGARLFGNPYGDRKLKWEDHNPYVLRGNSLLTEKPKSTRPSSVPDCGGTFLKLSNRRDGATVRFPYVRSAGEAVVPTSNSKLQEVRLKGAVASPGADSPGTIYQLTGSLRYDDAEGDPIRIISRPSVNGYTRFSMHFALTKDTIVSGVDYLSSQCDPVENLPRVTDAFLDDLDALRQ